MCAGELGYVPAFLDHGYYLNVANRVAVRPVRQYADWRAAMKPVQEHAAAQQTAWKAQTAAGKPLAYTGTHPWDRDDDDL